MKHPLVSIIMPCHNGERYLAASIQSVLAQTYRNWELLVIDDASTDASVDIVQAISQEDNRVKLLINDHPQGRPYAPRNYGISHAQGDYIAFLDCDDLWEASHLEHLLKVFEDNDDVVVACSWYGIQKGWYMNVAGGKARKSVLMAEDIANLLPLLAEKGGVYNVCDSYQPTMGELSISLAKQLGKHKPISLPYWMAWCAAKLGDVVGDRFPINSYKLVRMTNTLTFSNKKACSELGWKPLDVLENFSI